MNHKDYWERRQAEEMINLLEKADEVVKQIEVDYKLAYNNIKRELQKVYAEFAWDRYDEETDMHWTISQAEEYLDSVEYIRMIENIEPYLTQLQAGDKALIFQLETMIAKRKISRIDAIELEIIANMTRLADRQETSAEALLKDTLETSYYKKMFDMYGKGDDRVLQLMRDHKVAIPQNNFRAILERKWSGDNYSGRIWENSYKAAQRLRQDVVRNVLTGQNIESILEDAARQLTITGVNAYRRLLRTELAYVKGQGDLLTFKKLGVEEYEFMATLDNRTSEVCQSLDGKVFKVAEAVRGVNYPPMHPNCRSVPVTAIKGDKKRYTRSARDPVTGQVYQVRRDLTYREWYEEYVERGNEHGNFKG